MMQWILSFLGGLPWMIIYHVFLMAINIGGILECSQKGYKKLTIMFSVLLGTNVMAILMEMGVL